MAKLLIQEVLVLLNKYSRILVLLNNYFNFLEFLKPSGVSCPKTCVAGALGGPPLLTDRIVAGT